VAVLPGKDTLQPLATVSGLVRSAASARAEVASPANGGAEVGGGSRRRRGGRGARGSDAEAPAAGGFSEGSSNGIVALASSQESIPSTDAPQRRQEPEVLAVPMDAEQELVYGWMGLSPALLLDPVPTGENLMVRVVRPDADPEAVIEEARQQLAASGTRRRRRGRSGEGRNGTAEAPEASEVFEVSDASEAPDHNDVVPILEITPAPFEPEDAPAPSELVSVALPSRRSPGRSAPLAAAAAVPVAEAGPGEAGEPRRRRRRSSAAG
jgi:ribonuclease E